MLVRGGIVFDGPPTSSRASGTTPRTPMLDLEFMRLAFAAGAIVGVLAPAVGFFLVQRQLSLIGDGIGHVAFAGVAAGYLLGISPVLTALVAVGRRRGRDRVAARAGSTRPATRRSRSSSTRASPPASCSSRRPARSNVEPLRVPLRLDPDGDAQRPRARRRARGSPGSGRSRCSTARSCGVALDEEGARVAGVPVAVLNVVLAVLAAMTIAVSMRIVGILLIAALMVLPVIAATRIAWSMRSTLLLAMAIGLGACSAG